MKIARTILDQIKTLDPWALSAWGAENLTDMGDGLQFKTTGMTPFKGLVYIQYKPCPDLYNVKFIQVRNVKGVPTVKVRKIVVDVYAEDLIRTIDEFVG
jgi:hypothetical protein